VLIKHENYYLNERKKLANERTTDLTIDPQYYPQIIGAKGKNLEEVRSKFHNIQISFPDASGKSDKVTLHGDKDDVEKCSKFLQQKVKDLYSTEIDVSKRLYPLLIGKGGSNIQRLREQIPDVRIDIPGLEDIKESSNIRLSGKKIDVDKARLVGAPRAPPKACVESLPGPAEEAAPGCFASQFQLSAKRIILSPFTKEYRAQGTISGISQFFGCL
jgi:transcription antitermination factor NusA-like protein